MWNHVDLAAKRVFKRELPTVSLIIVDAFGFLSFLTLLIANGIIAEGLGMWRNGDAMLLAYTSVPWMFCWYVGFSLCICVSINVNTLGVAQFMASFFFKAAQKCCGAEAAWCAKVAAVTGRQLWSKAWAMPNTLDRYPGTTPMMR